MGYRDDFYVVANIIGYSGELNEFPTVYFRRGSEFGHITQEHPTPQNVGRTEVVDARGYTIGNEMVEDSVRLVEKINGRVIHTSRSTFKAVNPTGAADANTTALLAQAIYSCQGEKYISFFAPADMRKIHEAEANKAAVMGELLRPPIGHLLRAP